MSRLRIRQSQPNLAEVGVGAELGNKRRLQIISEYLQISIQYPLVGDHI